MNIDTTSYKIEDNIIFTIDADGVYRQEFDIPHDHFTQILKKFTAIDSCDYNCY